MAEQLGSLARTHTCGALRASRRRRRRGPARLGAEGARPRCAASSSTSAIGTASPRSSSQDDEALLERAKRLRAEFVVGDQRPGRAARRRDGQRQAADRRDRGARRRAPLLNEAKTPPFLIGEEQNVSEETRLRYRYLDLRRPPLQRNIGAAPPHHDGAAPLLRRAGLLRDRDADPHQVHARRARATSWCRAASIPGSSTRCRSRRRSSSRS